MGAYNWIDHEIVCPSCRRLAVIRIQFHYAASYDGDERGRFHDRWYRIGESLCRFEPSDPRFAQLNEDGIRDDATPGRILEYCYSRCRTCDAELFAAVAFQDLTILEVLHVGPEQDMPDRIR
jgi:hypothetical protein